MLLHILENQLRICTASELKSTTLHDCPNLHSNTYEPDLQKSNAHSAFPDSIPLLAVWRAFFGLSISSEKSN